MSPVVISNSTATQKPPSDEKRTEFGAEIQVMIDDNLSKSNQIHGQGHGNVQVS